MYINYEYTQTDEIDAVETFHETSLQFQRKDTIYTGQEIRKTSKSMFYNTHLDKLLLKDVQIIVLSIGFGCF